MPTLASELRNKLERVVIDARDAAEVGARAALEALAVHHHEPYPHMKPGPARAAQPPPRPGAATRGPAGRLRPAGPSTTWSASAPTSTGIGCSLPGSWPRTTC